MLNVQMCRRRYGRMGGLCRTGCFDYRLVTTAKVRLRYVPIKGDAWSGVGLLSKGCLLVRFARILSATKSCSAALSGAAGVSHLDKTISHQMR